MVGKKLCQGSQYRDQAGCLAMRGTDGENELISHLPGWRTGYLDRGYAKGPFPARIPKRADQCLLRQLGDEPVRTTVPRVSLARHFELRAQLDSVAEL